MSYNYPQQQQQQPYPGPPSRMPTTRTTDSFDPYSAASSRQRLNDPAGTSSNNIRYRDDVSNRPTTRVDTASAAPVREKSVRSSGGSRFSPTTPRYGEKEDFRAWRKGYYDNSLWTKGRGIGCFTRFFCCTILIALLLIISIVLTIAVYVRPPDVSFGSVELDTDKGALDVSTPGTFTINLRIPITIRNPNFFDAGFQSITAEAFYPVSGMADTPVGGGNQKNIVFKGGDHVSNTSFPIAITYDKSIDPTQAVILDIARRCGLIGEQTSNLPIKYTLQLKIKILVATISPKFNGEANFPCPANELRVVGNTLGIPGLGGTGA